MSTFQFVNVSQTVELRARHFASRYFPEFFFGTEQFQVWMTPGKMFIVYLYVSFMFSQFVDLCEHLNSIATSLPFCMVRAVQDQNCNCCNKASSLHGVLISIQGTGMEFLFLFLCSWKSAKCYRGLRIKHSTPRTLVTRVNSGQTTGQIDMLLSKRLVWTMTSESFRCEPGSPKMAVVPLSIFAPLVRTETIEYNRAIFVIW